MPEHLAGERVEVEATPSAPPAASAPREPAAARPAAVAVMAGNTAVAQPEVATDSGWEEF